MSKKPSPYNLEKINDLIEKISGSRKYKHITIPPDTIRDLLQQAESRGIPAAEIEKVVREKLHHVVAPYLGDPDYEKLKTDLTTLPVKMDSTILKDWCLAVLRTHASTRERIPILDEFYTRIFEFTGKPRSILDLACGLNPFSIPWMKLESDVRYDAFDLHQPRIDLINAFLAHTHQPGSGSHADILVQPPQQKADVAFFFKEAHRFDQRQSGINRTFFQAIPVKYLLVSLPTASLTGRRSMLDQDHRLIDQSISGLSWNVHEIRFENEIVFCIEKE